MNTQTVTTFIPEFHAALTGLRVDYNMDDWDRDKGLIYDITEELLNRGALLPRKFSLIYDTEAYNNLLIELEACEGTVFVFICRWNDIPCLVFTSPGEKLNADVLASFEFIVY